MGSMPVASAALHAELHDALMAEVSRVGPEGVNKAGVVAKFSGRGVSERTLFRWCAEVMDGGEPGQTLARKVKSAAAERAARLPDPAEAAVEVAAEARAMLPAPWAPARHSRPAGSAPSRCRSAAVRASWRGRSAP